MKKTIIEIIKIIFFSAVCGVFIWSWELLKRSFKWVFRRMCSVSGLVKYGFMWVFNWAVLLFRLYVLPARVYYDRHEASVVLITRCPYKKITKIASEACVLYCKENRGANQKKQYIRCNLMRTGLKRRSQ